MAKKKSSGSEACPCGSGATYRECCRAYHEGQEPPDVERLMRSRFCAFVRGDGEYLVRTTHPAHALRSRPHAEVVRELSRAKQTLRYRELVVHDARTEGERGQVLFTARVFEKGRDRSFVELSTFARAEGGWRYLDGLTVSRDALGAEPSTIDAFEASLGG